MVYFKIQSERQNNGLWGTPMNIVELKRGGFVDDFNELKFSAILMTMGEKYSDAYLSVTSIGSSNNIFFVDVKYKNSSIRKLTKVIDLRQYDMINNKLYYMDNDKDRLIVNRIKKLKKIQQNHKNII